MALPSLGETYSLLADAQGAEFRRRREEERRLERRASKDRLKYALLQPLVGAAASTGLKVLGDVVGGAFLGREALEKWNLSEQGRKATTDISKQDRAIVGTQALAKMTTDESAFKAEQLQHIRDQLARSQYKEIDYDSLSKLQKHNISAQLTSPEFQKHFDKEIDELITNINNLNTEMSTQFNSGKVAKFIKENPDIYTTQSAGKKLLTNFADKVASVLPSVDKRDRIRESYSIKFFGTKNESLLNDRQKGQLDWLSGVTGEGIPVKGVGARNYSLYQQYKTEADELSSNFYAFLKDKDVSNLSPIAAKTVSQYDNAVAALEGGEQNDIAMAYITDNDKWARLGVYREGVPYVFDASATFREETDGLADADLTNIIRNSGEVNAEKYNDFIEELKEKTGLDENQLTATIQKNILPYLLENFNSSVDNIFSSTYYKGNAFHAMGSLTGKERQDLVGTFLLQNLKNNVSVPGAEEPATFKFGGVVFEVPFTGKDAEGPIRIAVDNKVQDFDFQNTKILIDLLGESENLIAANENNTRGAVTETVIVKTGGERVNSEDTVSPPIKRPTPQGFFKSLPLLAKEAKKMKDEGNTSAVIRVHITDSIKKFLQSVMDNNHEGFSKEDLLEIDAAVDNLLDLYPLTGESEGNTSGSQEDGSDKLDKEPDPNSMLGTKQAAYKKLYSPGLLQPFGKVIGETVDDIASYRLNNLIEAGWSTAAIKEIGFTEEEIQAAQDSLLSDPNEKISIDSVFKTAFENQPLNSTTVKLFTDNPDGMTLPDVESPASFTVAARNKESSNHDAHGITQVKVSTAIQPGYNTPNIFKVADSLGVPYDEKLAQEAIAITAKGAASQDKMTTEEGPAWQQVVDLLRNPEVNVRLGALYFNNLLEHYDNNIIKAVIAYNAGPVRANSFTGDRSELRQETQDYLTKMGL